MPINQETRQGITPDKDRTSLPWRMVEYVFSKPLFAALCIGGGIHLLTAITVYGFTGKRYIDTLAEDWNSSPGMAVFKILIPILIPFVVTFTSKMINVRNIRHNLLRFPEANPDIVMKIDREGTPLYLNPSALTHLHAHGIPPEQAGRLLPEGHKRIIERLSDSVPVISEQSTLDGKTIDFTFRTFPKEDAVFVSGRDITERLKLEQSLAKAFDALGMMTEYVDCVMDSDMHDITDENQYKTLISYLLRNQTDDDPDKATHIFMATRTDRRNFEGHIYSKRGVSIVVDPDKITVDPTVDKVAIIKGESEIVWSNWEDEGESLEAYQSRFHPTVRAKVGTIKRYITYRSGDVAIIAFYDGKRVDRFHAQALKGLATFSGTLNRVSRETKETERAFIYTVEALARAAEANDEDTGVHILRVNEYSMSLARQLGLSEKFIRTIGYSAQMHDVGKIHVHPDILRKRGPLSDEEFASIRQHPLSGVRILGDSPRLKMAREIALTHHEKYDGTGYPNGLKGDGIPISGRIVNMADVYDALRQERSYKPSLSHDMAFKIITKGDGRTSPADFDPAVLEAFVEIQDTFREIFASRKE